MFTDIINLPNETCFGCSACMEICPKHCISMLPDDKGFLRPQIDISQCIGCKSCLRICQAEHPVERNSAPTTVFAAQIKDKDALKNSSSGGIAWLLSKTVIQQGGVVYGACFDDKMVVRHQRIATNDDLNKLQGSKYVQSDLSEIYGPIKQDLNAGLLVLFIGTPCQVGAIKKIFNFKSERLLTCDLVCHSVPSPRLFADHIKIIEKSFGKKVVDYRFRDKTIGWSYNLHKIIYNDGTTSMHSYWNQCYKRLFFLGLMARESCYHCPYSSISRVGDISLGDYWGINAISDKFTEDIGVNVVFLNSAKGTFSWNQIQDQCFYIETELKQALQKHLVMPCEKTAQVDAFWSYYTKTSYKKACEKFAGCYLYLTIRNRIKDYLVKNRLKHV